MNVRKRHHSEICIAINDESQGSIATNLRCDELLHYTFIIHSAGKIIFNIGEHLAKLQALLSSKMQISPDKLNNLCITDRNCY